MLKKITWQIPLSTVSESNCSENRWVKSKRHATQQLFIRALFNRETKDIPLPCNVILTRISPRFLDDDNLPMSMKWIRDEIGACLFPDKVVIYKKKSGKYASNKGHADSDPRVKWIYAQEKGQALGIRIEFESCE